MSVINSDSVRAGASGVTAGYTIENSAWFDGSNDYIGETTIWDGNTTKWAMSIWFKRGDLGRQQYLWYWRLSSNDEMGFNANDTIYWGAEAGGVFQTTRVFRDPTAWVNIVAVWDTNASNGSRGDDVNDRMRLYVNGVHETAGTLSAYPGSGTESAAVGRDASGYLNVGAKNAGSPHNDHAHWNGYLTDFIILDNPTGATPAAMGLGEFDSNNVWVPLNPADLTFGSGGCWFDFQTNTDYGSDESGNSNDMTDYSMTTAQQTLDSPTDDTASNVGNYATWNPLHRGTTFVATLSEGNKKLDYTGTAGTNNSSAVSTVPFQATGKYYAEVVITTAAAGRTFVGTLDVTTVNDGNSQFYGNNTATSQGWYIQGNAGSNIYHIDGKAYPAGGSGATYGNTYTTGDIIGIYWNQGTVYFTKNEALQDSATEAEVKAGTTTNAAFSSLTDAFLAVGHCADFTLRTDPTDWSYTPFSGFLPLCTANLAAPSVPDGTLQYFTNTFTGDGSETAITVGGTSSFQPGMVHVKEHDAAGNWGWVDEVRGVTNTLVTNSVTDDQIAIAEGVKSFDSGGVTLGTDSAFTDNTDKFMVDFFKGSASSGSTLDAGSQDATVSVNDTAGWSFGVYEGTGSNLTFAHGLSAAPEFIMIKNIDANSTKYIIFHNNSDATAPEDYYLTFGSSIAKTDDATAWQDTAPSSTLVTIGTLADVNTSGDTHWFWACRSVAGFSKMGRYVGNADASSGPVSFLGFKPAFLWTKESDSNAGDANMTQVGVHDYNPSGNHYWGHPDVYDPDSTRFDLGANFFRPIIAGSAVSRSGSRYVYLSFAQHPFGGSGVAQARGF
jgi:hypothetical protein